LSEDVQLQVPRQFGQLGGTRRIEDDLERLHPGTVSPPNPSQGKAPIRSGRRGLDGESGDLRPGRPRSFTDNFAMHRWAKVQIETRPEGMLGDDATPSNPEPLRSSGSSAVQPHEVAIGSKWNRSGPELFAGEGTLARALDASRLIAISNDSPSSTAKR
jgi:hypothetical protein